MNSEKYIQEVSIDAINEDSPRVGYIDGDIAIIDTVRELTELNAMKAKLNFIIGCSQGCIELDVNGMRRRLERGDVLFSCPGVVLDNFMISPDFECTILCLSDRIIHELLSEHIETWNKAVYIRRANVVSLSDADVQLHALYHALITHSLRGSDRRFHKQAIQSLVRALLFELSSILYEPEPAEKPVYQTQGRQLFDRFLSMLAKEKVKRRPVGYYAYELSITPKYLTMVCEHESGKPAKDWINQYVTEDVRYYLRNTATPIKEIADHLGFANISHFGSYVRRHFGVSPSLYRSQESHDRPTEPQGSAEE